MLIGDTGKAIGAAIAAVLIYAGTFGFVWFMKRRQNRVQDMRAGAEWYPLASNATSHNEGLQYSANMPSTRTDYMGPSDWAEPPKSTQQGYVASTEGWDAIDGRGR
jgi:hypothetical protein